MTQSPLNRDDRGAGAPKTERRSLRDRTVTITLSMPKAIFGGLFCVVVLIWVFILGIMIGRGLNPEEAIPELAKVMPAPASPENNGRNDMDEVIRSRDLQYHDSLKNRDAVAQPRPTQQQTPSPATTSPPSTHPKPATQTPPPSPPVQAQTPPRTTAPEIKPGQDQTVYDYIYQVAASNNAASAENLRKKLQQGGFTAKVTQSESNGIMWYRIMVSFKGKPEDTRKLREKLAEYGINAIILRGKAPSQ